MDLEPIPNEKYLNKQKAPLHDTQQHFEGILPKGPYPPCLRMADRAFLAGYTCDLWIEKYNL